MKLILLLVVVVFAIFVGSLMAADEEDSVFVRIFNKLHGEPPPPPSVFRARTNVQTSWIEQKLDNFDEAEKRTWQMRYMSNDEFYQEGGPLFIFVGGEWEISEGYMSGGHFYDMAREHNAYLFYTEHRYYGQSKPTEDISIENLKYLHVLQALDDLAHFIRTMKSTIPGMTNSKVILAGGSYSANMVTWFKKLYPDLAIGCWASSAPLFAKVDFVEYAEATGASIRLVGGGACYNRIKNGIAEMEDMFANRRGAEVKKMLRICDNFDESSELNIWTLFSLISNFAGLVERHIDGDIQSACVRIMGGENDLSGVASFITSAFGLNKTCNDLSYKALLAELTNSAYTNSIMRPWLYQSCNEYGYFKNSGSRAQPFGTKFPLELYIKMCVDTFGAKFSKEFIEQQVAGTNKMFGGLTPKVENVHFTHGQLDPWYSMGIQDTDQATVIPLYAHCKDLASISANDTREMRAAKEEIAELVREWIDTPAA